MSCQSKAKSWSDLSMDPTLDFTLKALVHSSVMMTGLWHIVGCCLFITLLILGSLHHQRIITKKQDAFSAQVSFSKKVQVKEQYRRPKACIKIDFWNHSITGQKGWSDAGGNAQLEQEAEVKVILWLQELFPPPDIQVSWTSVDSSGKM